MILTLVFNSIYYSITYSIYYSIVLGLWIISLSVLSKPKEESFKPFLNHYLKYSDEIIVTDKKNIDKFVNKCDVYITDEGPFKLANVKMENQEPLVFAGAFGYWYSL